MKMFIDKFYRSYSPYNKPSSTTIQSRSPKASLNLNGEYNWDALSYNIVNVKDGTDFTDASNMQQTLPRGKNSFVQCKYKYEFIEVDKDKKWDGQNRILTQNIKYGVESNDVVSVGQTLVCDSKKANKSLFKPIF